MIKIFRTYKNYILIIFFLGLVIWSYIIATNLSYNLTEMTDREIDKQLFNLKMNLTLIFFSILSLSIRYRGQLKQPQ